MVGGLMFSITLCVTPLALLGLLTLVSSLSIFHNHEISKFLLFLFINIILIVLSFILEQRVFLVFGVIGLIECSFLGYPLKCLREVFFYLSYTPFWES